MFSQVSVYSQGCVCRGLCASGGACAVQCRGWYGRCLLHPPRWPLPRSICIILECILVTDMFSLPLPAFAGVNYLMKYTHCSKGKFSFKNVTCMIWIVIILQSFISHLSGLTLCFWETILVTLLKQSDAPSMIIGPRQLTSQSKCSISRHSKTHMATEFPLTTKPHVVEAWHNADEAFLVWPDMMSSVCDGHQYDITHSHPDLCG